jgi:hypothetical protein
MQNATYLPISAAALEAAGYDIGGLTALPDAAGSSAASQTICAAVSSYVANWIETHSLPIRYIVGLCGLPSRDTSEPVAGYPGGNSVSYEIYSALLDASSKSGYNGVSTDPFSVAEYGAPLVAWLDCGYDSAAGDASPYAATYAFIKKEIAAANAHGLLADGITISGTAANVNGSTYILDNTTTYGINYFGQFDTDLVNLGVTDINYQYLLGGPTLSPSTNPIASPTAYGSWGEHAPMSPTWPVDGTVAFTQNAGWWVGMSVESYNGIYDVSNQGNMAEFFSAHAFGSGSNLIADYANTPICFVGSTTEPYEPNNEGAAYFAGWASGSSTLEAAWAGRNTPYFLAVTDVCLTP